LLRAMAMLAGGCLLERLLGVYLFGSYKTRVLYL